MRRTKYLIPSLVAAGFGHGDPAQAAYVRSATGPRDDSDRGALIDVFRQDHTVTLADHRSHSSHSSHRSSYGGGGHYSHTSHRSSSGGSYYGETYTPVRPVYTPPPPPQPDPVVPAPPRPLFSPLERAAPVKEAPSTLSGRTRRFASIVRRVQIALLARRLYEGPIDGVVGPKLRAALRRFQSQRSLSVTGTITPDTLNALMVSSE